MTATLMVDSFVTPPIWVTLTATVPNHIIHLNPTASHYGFYSIRLRFSVDADPTKSYKDYYINVKVPHPVGTFDILGDD